MRAPFRGLFLCQAMRQLAIGIEILSFIMEQPIQKLKTKNGKTKNYNTSQLYYPPIRKIIF